MSKQRGLIVNDWGQLYRISKKNWERFCKAQVKAEDLVGIQEFGAKPIGVIDADMTDANVEWWAERLEMEK